MIALMHAQLTRVEIECAPDQKDMPLEGELSIQHQAGYTESDDTLLKLRLDVAVDFTSTGGFLKYSATAQSIFQSEQSLSKKEDDPIVADALVLLYQFIRGAISSMSGCFPVKWIYTPHIPKSRFLADIAEANNLPGQ